MFTRSGKRCRVIPGTCRQNRGAGTAQTTEIEPLLLANILTFTRFVPVRIPGNDLFLVPEGRFHFITKYFINRVFSASKIYTWPSFTLSRPV